MYSLLHIECAVRYSLLYIECTVILCYRWSVVLFSVTDRMCCYSPFHKECALILC